MAEILFIDDKPLTVQYYKDALIEHGHQVTFVTDPAEIDKRWLEQNRFDIAIVDMSYTHSSLSGLDVFGRLNRWMPSCSLFLFTNAENSQAEIVALAWEAFPITIAMAKSVTRTEFLSSIDLALGNRHQRISDVEVGRWLPEVRNERRKADNFARVFNHVGHAELIEMLYHSPTVPTHLDIADEIGKTLATVNTYLGDVRRNLTLLDYHLDGLPALHQFARLAKGILEPEVEAKKYESKMKGKTRK